MHSVDTTSVLFSFYNTNQMLFLECSILFILTPESIREQRVQIYPSQYPMDLAVFLVIKLQSPTNYPTVKGT